MRANKRTKKTLSILMCLCMLAQYVPTRAFAAETGGLCEHHTEHTTDCGYSPGAETVLCTHDHEEGCWQQQTSCVHTSHDESCGYVEGEAACSHACSEESTCVTRVLNCGHLDDGSCCYQAAVTPTACGFTCGECKEEDGENSDDTDSGQQEPEHEHTPKAAYGASETEGKHTVTTTCETCTELNETVEEDHTYSDGICACGAEEPAHEHILQTVYTESETEGKHTVTVTCETCTELTEVAEEDHTGEATCETEASCEKCGESYFAQHTYVEGECSVCGAEEPAYLSARQTEKDPTDEELAGAIFIHTVQAPSDKATQITVGLSQLASDAGKALKKINTPINITIDKSECNGVTSSASISDYDRNLVFTTNAVGGSREGYIKAPLTLQDGSSAYCYVHVELYDRNVVTISGIEPEDYIYDGQKKSGYSGTPVWLNSDGSEYTGEKIIEHYDSTGQKLTDKPTEIGTYSVSFSVPETEDQAGSMTLTFRICDPSITNEAAYQTAPDGEWQTSSFVFAANQVYAGGTVKLLKNISVDDASVYLCKDMTVTSEGDSPFTITSNTAYSGHLLQISGDVTMTNVIVDGGYALATPQTRQSALIAVNGGTLMLGSDAMLQNNYNNSAGATGGGVVVVDGEFQIDGGSIVNCRAIYGGGLYLQNSMCSVKNGLIKNCHSNYGGGIYAQGASSIMLLDDASIESNEGKYGGGGAFLVGASSLTLNGGKINDCKTTMPNKTQKYRGGGVCLNEEASLSIQFGSIASCYAVYGGGVYAGGNSKIELLDGTISENTSMSYGGGICIGGETAYVEVLSGSLSGNSVTGNNGFGGGVCLLDGTFVMRSGSISNNSASNGYGGAIFSMQATVGTTGSLSNISNVYLLGGALSNNSAKNGGGVVVQSSAVSSWNGEGTWGETVISNASITGNTATVRAGGVEIAGNAVVHISEYAYITGNMLIGDSTSSDVIFRSYSQTDVENIGVIIIDAPIKAGSVIGVDTLYKKSNPSEEKTLLAKGTDTHTITTSDFHKFICTNPDYDLILEDASIYLVQKISATSVSLSVSDLILNIGDTKTLTAALEPENTTSRVIWTSSDPTIATVDANGTVTALQSGEVTITATAGDVSASCTVTVLAGYTVSYALNGGTAADGVDYSTETVPKGTSITVKAAPTRDGYTFDGWSDGTNTYQPGATITVNEDLTLTAQWTEILTFTVTYTDGVEDAEIFANQMTQNLTYGANTPAFDGTPTRDGYTFTGWSPAVADTVTGDATYVAQWSQITYTVTYADGVEGRDIFPNEVHRNLLPGTKTPDFLGTLKRKGYVFKGWNPQLSETVTENVTYTAIWMRDRNDNGIADKDEWFGELDDVPKTGDRILPLLLICMTGAAAAVLALTKKRSRGN